MLKLKFWYLGKTCLYFLKKRNAAQTIVSLAFLFILTLLAFASFISGKLFIQYLNSFESFAKVLLRFTLLSMISTLSLLSVVSFTIAYLKTFYEKNLSLLILGSGSFKKITISVFVTTLLFGSWPFLLISLPFFLGVAQDLPRILAIHLLLILLTAALSGTLSLFIQTVAGRVVQKLQPWLLLLFLILLYLLFTKVIYPYNLGLISQVESVSSVENSLWQLPIANKFLPTTMFVDVFLGDNLRILDLILTTIFSLLVFAFAVKILYKKSWQRSFAGYLLPQEKRVNQSFLNNPTLALFQKEIYSQIRSQNSLIYLSFIIFLSSILIFYLSQAKRVTGEYYTLTPLSRGASYFAISYLLLLFTLRFVFPSLTLERPYQWLTITVSKIKEKILKTKWLFYQILSLIFIFLLGLLTGNSSNIWLLSSLSLLLTTFALTLGGVFMSSLPKQDTEAIATTSPGILLTVVSLLTGAFISWLLLTNNSSYLPLVLLLFSFSLMGICFYLVKKVFASLDI